MRIAGITIPNDKRLEISLTSIYGIGRVRAIKILNEAKISFEKKTKDLSEKEEGEIRKLIEEYRIEGNLKRDISSNIKRLKDIKSYKGSRHTKQLPARGQRTKTNSRTIRPYQGRKTMGSGKKKTDKK